MACIRVELLFSTYHAEKTMVRNYYYLRVKISILVSSRKAVRIGKVQALSVYPWGL